MLNIRLEGKLPIYEQLYNGIARLVSSGELVPDEKLPAVREVAKQFGINPNTVQKAYAQLEQSGLIYSIPAKGSYVSPEKAAAAAVKGEALRKTEQELRCACRAGIALDEIISLDGTAAVLHADGQTALDGKRLTIPEGCAYGLLGSNGAGKSTLLRVLSGIYRLNSGEVKIDGNAVYDNAAMKERVFFINDETVQFNNMTLTEMKNYYKRFYSSFSDELWQKLYSTLNLPLKKRLNTFSKGMKRQAAVICGIACRTPYLFLDEAFDGLDPTMRIIVKQMLIDAMMDTGLTVIFRSHNLGEIDEFCDRVRRLHARKRE